MYLFTSLVSSQVVRAEAFDPTDKRYDLVEVRVHGPTGQLLLAHPDVEDVIASAAKANTPMHVEGCAKTQDKAARAKKAAEAAGEAAEGKEAEWALKVVPYCGKKYL
jgi:hypothetical protein